MITWDQLQKQLRQCDDVVTGQRKSIPCKESEAESYMWEMQRELVRQLSALYQRQVNVSEFTLHTRLTNVDGGKQHAYVSIHPQMYGQLRTDLILFDSATLNNVEVRVGQVLEGTKLSDVLKKRAMSAVEPDKATGAALGKLAALTGIVRPVHQTLVKIDGLTPQECLDRYEQRMRADSPTGATALTYNQRTAASALWSSRVSRLTKASEHARHEADRLQVVVDFEED